MVEQPRFASLTKFILEADRNLDSERYDVEDYLTSERRSFAQRLDSFRIDTDHDLQESSEETLDKPDSGDPELQKDYVW
jgi:hypothetical protein